jgi:hypothetical protein
MSINSIDVSIDHSAVVTNSKKGYVFRRYDTRVRASPLSLVCATKAQPLPSNPCPPHPNPLALSLRKHPATITILPTYAHPLSLSLCLYSISPLLYTNSHTIPRPHRAKAYPTSTMSGYCKPCEKDDKGCQDVRELRWRRKLRYVRTFVVAASYESVG